MKKKILTFLLLSLLLALPAMSQQPYAPGTAYLHLSPQVQQLLAELDVLKYAQYNSHAYFVNAYSGSATNSGTLTAPVQKIQAGIDLCISGRGDFVVLQPTDGTDYDDDVVGASLTNAYIYVNKSNLTIVGMNGPAMGEVIIQPDAAASVGVINLGAAADRVRLVNLTIVGTTAANELIQATAGANYVTVEHCLLRDGTKAIDAPGTCSAWMIQGNTFIDQTLSAIYGYFSLGTIKNNTFKSFQASNTADIDTLGVIRILDNTTTANSDGCLIMKNIILGGDATAGSGSYNAESGIRVAAACLNVGVVGNYVAGCDTCLYGTAANGQYFMGNFGSDGSGGEYVDSEVNLLPLTP